MKSVSETIGDGGSGSFYQTGGTHTVDTLLLGNGNTGFGSYSLAGGMLDAKIIDLKTGGGEANFGFSGGAIISVEEFRGNLLNNGGILSPGSSPGTTLIDGYYVQSSLGSLLMEFDGGNTAGIDFDLLNVTGTAYLGGTLIVSLLDGFIPSDESLYTFLTAGAISGTFDTVSLPTLADWTSCFFVFYIQWLIFLLNRNAMKNTMLKFLQKVSFFHKSVSTECLFRKLFQEDTQADLC